MYTINDVPPIYKRIREHISEIYGQIIYLDNCQNIKGLFTCIIDMGNDIFIIFQSIQDNNNCFVANIDNSIITAIKKPLRDGNPKSGKRKLKTL